MGAVIVLILIIVAIMAIIAIIVKLLDKKTTYIIYNQAYRDYTGPKACYK